MTLARWNEAFLAAGEICFFWDLNVSSVFGSSKAFVRMNLACTPALAVGWTICNHIYSQSYLVTNFSKALTRRLSLTAILILKHPLQ